MENKEKKVKSRKKVIVAFLDILTAITLVLAITLGIKYSYEVYYSKYQTEKSLVAMEEALDKKITREEFVPVDGEVAFKLKIMGITDWIPVVEGESLPNLEKGAAHLSQTGFPSDSRQIFIAGHRETHFKNIDQVQKGDDIQVVTPYGVFDYVVDRTEIVPETKVEVINTALLDEDELVLMTCYPFANWATADERFLVYAYPKK